jgi:hypothetical protein
MITILLTAAEYATYRNISKKIDQGKVDESIKDAQQSDLLNTLDEFYFDVVENFTNPNYADLLAGSSFIYSGKKYEHAGIKALLADYTHARFVYSSPVTFTPFGLVEKLSNDSQPVDTKILDRLSKQAQIDAGFKFKYIEKYILSDPVLFSRYCKNKDLDTGFNYQKFSKLRG